MKKLILYLTIISIFLIPSKVSALREGETEKLYMNIDILENGSLKVKEYAVLKPNFNGRYRSLRYKNNNAQTFTGSKEDFDGSDIYNAFSISNLIVGDAKLNLKSDAIKNMTIEDTFEEIYSDINNDKVYLKSAREDGIDLKIYNSSDNNRAFFLEYTYDNVAVVHNDIAEVAWNILGENYEDNIEELIVLLNLPKEDKNMRVWLHGPLDGVIKRINDKQAKITYHNLPKNNAVSFRMMFSKTLIPQANKYSNINGKENILEVEQKAADAANKQREKAKIIQNTVKYLVLIWYVMFIGVMAIVLKDKKIREKCDFNHDYLRDFPADYGPEIVEYLIYKKVSDDGLSASILNIINKRAITTETLEGEKDNYTLTMIPDKCDSLTESEKQVVNILFNIIGTKDKVTLKQIKEFGSRYDGGHKFLMAYNKWKSTVTQEAEQEQFYTSMPFVCLFECLLGIIGVFLTFICAIIESSFILGYISAVVGIIGIIYVCSLKYMTPKGVLHYKKWMALKKFMLDFGNMDEKELPEIIVWEKYLVYATVLGCADKLRKDMKTRFDQMNITESTYPDFYYLGYYDHMFLHHSLTRSISSGIHQTYTNSISSNVANSISSSGSGFGGGAVGGGGSFGGGGGGGHF